MSLIGPGDWSRASWAKSQRPTSSAGPVLRAGLTEVLVTGIEIRRMSVSASPIASGAKGAGERASVAPRMTTRKPAVSSASTRKALARS